MMNGARGLSVLFASGDQGVWGRTGHSETIPGFHPDFPAGSPYITAVGGTQFATTSVLGDETTWADGGGGFSDTFAAPDYQLDAVKSYFSSGVDLPPSSDYNATGRGYPDVAALAGQANGYCVAARGNYLKVGGTSAACPVFAGHGAAATGRPQRVDPHRGGPRGGVQRRDHRHQQRWLRRRVHGGQRLGPRHGLGHPQLRRHGGAPRPLGKLASWQAI
jgi:hypothetical protein